MWEPVGPLPAAVYWRRRWVALASAVTLVGLAIVTAGGARRAPVPAANPASRSSAVRPREAADARAPRHGPAPAAAAARKQPRSDGRGGACAARRPRRHVGPSAPRPSPGPRPPSPVVSEHAGGRRPAHPDRAVPRRPASTAARRRPPPTAFVRRARPQHRAHPPRRHPAPHGRGAALRRRAPHRPRPVHERDDRRRRRDRPPRPQGRRATPCCASSSPTPAPSRASATSTPSRQEIVVWSGDGRPASGRATTAATRRPRPAHPDPRPPVAFAVTWAGRTSTPGCAQPRTVVPAGNYRVMSRLDDDQPPDPVPAHPARP